MRGSASEAKVEMRDRREWESRPSPPHQRSLHHSNHPHTHSTNHRQVDHSTFPHTHSSIHRQVVHEEDIAMAKRRRDDSSERSAWRIQEDRLEYDQSNRSRGCSTLRVHRSSQRGRTGEAQLTEEVRDKGKAKREIVLEDDADQEYPSRRRLSYAEVAKGSARKPSPARFNSRRSSPSGLARVTKHDDEGEWLLVKSRKSIKTEKRRVRDESASVESGQQCHKCAQWGHSIARYTNDWFCYACRKSGHISRDCPTFKRMPTPSSTAPRAASPTISHTSKTQESFAGGRTSVKALITPTPLMAEFERRFHMFSVIKVQSGNPMPEDIEGLLYDNITPSETLQWRVQRLSSSVLPVHCHDEDRLQEVLGKRGLGFDDYYVTFSQWSRKYGALQQSEMPSIWLRLSNFPFHCWLRYGFQNLVRAFGFLQEVDKSTITQERREFARIKISCEDFSLLPSMVQVEFEGEFFDVKVIVEKKKNVSFAKISSREEDECSDDRKKGPDLRRSKVEDDGGPSILPEQNLGRSARFKDRESFKIADEYGTNLKTGIQIGVRAAGKMDDAQRCDGRLCQEAHDDETGAKDAYSRKQGILKNRSSVDIDARDRRSTVDPGFALLSKEDLQASIKSAIEELERRGGLDELERRGGFDGYEKAPDFQGRDAIGRIDHDSALLPLTATLDHSNVIIPTGPIVSNDFIPSGLISQGPAKVGAHGPGVILFGSINQIGLQRGSVLEVGEMSTLGADAGKVQARTEATVGASSEVGDEEGVGENSHRLHAVLEEEKGVGVIDSDQSLEQSAQGIDSGPIDGMIGALDGLQSGGSTYDSEHEKWAKQVRELAGEELGTV